MVSQRDAANTCQGTSWGAEPRPGALFTAGAVRGLVWSCKGVTMPLTPPPPPTHTGTPAPRALA